METPLNDDRFDPKSNTGNEIFREIITIRPTTTTREPMRLTVSQRVADNGEIAVATSILTGAIPTYFEKPEIMEDIAKTLINGAYLMRKANKRVNGKR